MSHDKNTSFIEAFNPVSLRIPYILFQHILFYSYMQSIAKVTPRSLPLTPHVLIAASAAFKLPTTAKQINGVMA